MTTNLNLPGIVDRKCGGRNTMKSTRWSQTMVRWSLIWYADEDASAWESEWWTEDPHGWEEEWPEDDLQPVKHSFVKRLP